MDPVLSRKEFLASLGAFLLTGWSCKSDEPGASTAGAGAPVTATPMAGAGPSPMGTTAGTAPMGGLAGTNAGQGAAAGVGAAGTGAGTTAPVPVVDAAVPPAVDASTAVDAGQDPADAATADAAADAGGGTMCAANVMATSSGGHTHTLMISAAAIMQGGTQQFETGVGLGHTHWVELNDADFAMLRSGGTVMKTTCSGGDHGYELRCGENITADEVPAGCNDECGNAQDNVCA